MNENLTWAWLAAGLVPYHIEKRYPSRRERIVTIRALFWTLEVRTRWLRPTRRGRRQPALHRLDAAHPADRAGAGCRLGRRAAAEGR